MPSPRRLSTRDRNLGKIAVVLPTSVALVGRVVYEGLRAVGLERNPALATLGFVAATYVAARLRVALRRGGGASEAKFLQERCGGSALITGCTSGLGLAWAEGLAKRGVRKLVLVSRSEAKLRELATRLMRENATLQVATPVPFDFVSGDASDFYEKTLPAALREHGVGLIVNNVGLGTEDPLPLSELSTAEIDDMIAVNCGATAKMSRAAVSFFLRRRDGDRATVAVASKEGPPPPQRGGVVVNVSSGSAAQPTPYLTVYAATKAFVTHFSRSLDREMRALRAPVKVLTAQPYYISGTGMFKARPSFNAPAASVVVSGTLKDLVRRPHRDLSHTCPGHALINFLFVCIAEDPVLGPLGLRLSKYLGFNGSMLMVMAKARERFLAKSHSGAGKKDS